MYASNEKIDRQNCRLKFKRLMNRYDNICLPGAPVELPELADLPTVSGRGRFELKPLPPSAGGCACML